MTKQNLLEIAQILKEQYNEFANGLTILNFLPNVGVLLIFNNEADCDGCFNKLEEWGLKADICFLTNKSIMLKQ